MGQGQLHTLLQCIALWSKTSDFLNYGCLLSRVHQSVVGQLHGEGGCARGQCPNSCRVAQKFSKWTLNSQHLQWLSISSLTQHHRKENLSNGGKKMFQDGLGKWRKMKVIPYPHIMSLGDVEDIGPPPGEVVEYGGSEPLLHHHLHHHYWLHQLAASLCQHL